MRLRSAFAVALLGSLAGCDSILDTEPADELPEDQAIVDADGARAALAGAYQVFQSLSDYGGDFVFFGDLSADNAVSTGTFSTYAAADANQLRADNVTVYDIWNVLYDGVNRANIILEKVPPLTDLEDAERNEILGQAHFLRALHYHNLVKFYGGVPIRLVPVKNVDQAADISRSSVAEVYAQVLSDLGQAEQMIASAEPATQATTGAVKALLARVYLYQQDYANALAKADEVIGLGYDLAPAFGDLFDEEGADTDEDILKVIFTLQQASNLGFYYFSTELDGDGNVAPAQSLIDAFDPTDTRREWSIDGDTEGTTSGIKFPTTNGAEDFHVIRFAEVLLIRAEAQARLGDLAGAVDSYNRLRERAELDPHVLGVDVTTSDEVLAAIDQERRVELAFEGDRWPDLVRTGQAVSVLGIPEFQALYPVPQPEIDIVPGMTQNPGY